MIFAEIQQFLINVINIHYWIKCIKKNLGLIWLTCLKEYQLLI